MRSIVTVASPALETALTTLERVKLELNITNAASDEILQDKIDEASDDIEAALGFRVVRETAEQTFWHEQYDSVPDRLISRMGEDGSQPVHWSSANTTVRVRDRAPNSVSRAKARPARSAWSVAFSQSRLS